MGEMAAKKPEAKEERRWELENFQLFPEGSCSAEVGTQDRLPSLPLEREKSDGSG